MIALLARVTGFSPALIETAIIFVLIALAVAASILTYQHAYNTGYSSGATAERAKAAIAASAESERQAEANREAQRAAALIISQLRADKADLEDQLKANSDAADADPDRDDVGLSAGSVQRHNILIHRREARPAGGGQRPH